MGVLKLCLNEDVNIVFELEETPRMFYRIFASLGCSFFRSWIKLRMD